MTPKSLLLLILPLMVHGWTPYTPRDQYFYLLEAPRAQGWPGCINRFLTFDTSNSNIDLQVIQAVRNPDWIVRNQIWRLIKASQGFYIQNNGTGQYLTFSSTCSVTTLSLSATAGTNQQFSVTSTGKNFQVTISPVGPANCNRYLTFPSACTPNFTPDSVSLGTTPTSWNIHPANDGTTKSPVQHIATGGWGCADIFPWVNGSQQILLACTGGNLNIFSAPSLSVLANFTLIGQALSGSIPFYMNEDNGVTRGSPEVFQQNGHDYIFFSAGPGNNTGIHRIAWARSNLPVQTGGFNQFPANPLGLTLSVAGEIDPNIFKDPSTGKTYVIWKTDDNRLNWTYTRLWIQEIVISDTQLQIQEIGKPLNILNSTNIWWSNSWVNLGFGGSQVGGSLIEGPELIKVGSYYYLFFASGRYCNFDYLEGVARSTNLLGPYEVLGVPLLSSGIVGNAENGQKIVGPGHGGFLTNPANSSQWYMVYPASVGGPCSDPNNPSITRWRHAIVAPVIFTPDGWPYIDFSREA